MLRSPFTRLVTIGLLFASSAAAHDLVEEVTLIVDLMNLRPGIQVADVGAGSGEFSEEIAHRLGGSGHVYVNEVDDGELTKIRRRLEKSELTNMSLVVGETDDTNLPEACCDAILLRFVYHHMSDRTDMSSSLRRSLRPGGLLVVVEKEERGDGVAADSLIADMVTNGFEVVSRHPEWGGHDGHYGVVFRRVEESQ
jgi:ubiquinone/menaquinone biosynthesis C-methylase UbiE